MTYAIFLLACASAAILFGNRDIRRHFVIGGLCALPLIVIDPLLRLGYFEQLSHWQLFRYFLELALFSFLFGGLSVVLYELVFSTHFTKLRSEKRRYLSISLVGLIIGLLLFLLGAVPLVVSIIIGLSLNVILLIIFRADLLWDATFSAIGTGMLYAVLFSLVAHGSGTLSGLWFTDSLSGATIAGLPFEELVVVALFGAFFGPIYSAIKSLYER